MKIERDLKPQNKMRAWFYSKTMVFVLLVVAFFMVRATWHVFNANVESAKKFENSAALLEELQEREATLTRDLERVQTDIGKEEEIRKKFSVVKEGEQLVVVVGAQKEQHEEVEEHTWWQEITAGIMAAF
jgi:type II secretory pathway component PulJ